MPQQPEDDVDASPSYSPMDLHEETPVRERRAPANPLSWIVVVIILLVLLSVLTSVYNREQRASLEYRCSLQYERDTTQWQHCIDDR